ncbi:YheC/YheD family protein [Paenibacillus athensensis]|uniref:YheC/YheD family protein n=1 Tax=Paenibacillus athensensis TaxID=1967502 RepID=A0A4Y8PX64_9BACL|nr:YheC/YheD family protein [Paenibacillus athensensis]MCD1258060.1 YheC/YheD family protein [Paenibacillus athensensis]
MDASYAGILVNDVLFSQLPTGQTGYEAVQFYVQAGQADGLIPIFFRMQDVQWTTMQVHAYVPESGGFVRRWLPIPAVIHNRAIYGDRRSNRELSRWSECGIAVFNGRNRYSKLLIHRLLMEQPALRPHLPVTLPASPTSIRSLMRSFSSLIIKPSQSSIGRGIMKLERAGGGWSLTYPDTLRVSNRRWRTVRFRTGLPLVLLRRIASMPYVVQQRLPLATAEGRPFDMRVSVQRGGDGCWGVSGIVAKVAAPHLYVTNVALGGQVRRLPELLAEACPHLNGEAVIAGMRDFALRVAEQLSARLPHMADLGLDIGLSTDGFPLFIECNGKDQRYSFKEADMLEEWQATYAKPMAYAAFLLRQAGKMPPAAAVHDGAASPLAAPPRPEPTATIHAAVVEAHAPVALPDAATAMPEPTNAQPASVVRQAAHTQMADAGFEAAPKVDAPTGSPSAAPPAIGELLPAVEAQSETADATRREALMNEQAIAEHIANEWNSDSPPLSQLASIPFAASDEQSN